MSLTFKPKAEQRSISYQDVWGSDSPLDNPINSGGTQAGLRLIPVYAATGLIADMIATAPMAAFRQSTDGSWSRVTSQPQLVTNPNPYGSTIDWLHQCITSVLLRGNAYGYVVALDNQGYPAQIIWLNPDDVMVIEEQTDWFHTPRYYWRGRPLDINLVVHIPGYTLSGSCKGLSPLALFKLQVDLGLRASRFGDDWFKNGATPSGILQNKAREISSDVADGAKSTFKAAVANRDLFVTGSDWNYTTLAVPGNESQFLETIKANATQIAAIYRVSPEDIGGETGTSLTYKTLTSDQTRLTVRTLNPWAQRIAWYLSNIRPGPQFIKFDLDFLARGDKKSREEATALALVNGTETLDEARAAVSKPPLTPEQLAFWQQNHGKAPPAPPVPIQPAGDVANGA